LGLTFTFKAPIGGSMIISMMVEDTCDGNYGAIRLYENDGMLEIVAQSNSNWIISKAQLGSPVSVIDTDHSVADYRHLYHCSKEYGLIDAKTLKDGILPIDYSISSPNLVNHYPYTKPYDNCPGIIDLQYDPVTLPEVPYTRYQPISLSFWMYIEYTANQYDIILSSSVRTNWVDLVSYRTGGNSYIYFSCYKGAYNCVDKLTNNAWNYITLGHDTNQYWYMSVNNNPFIITNLYGDVGGNLYFPNVITQVPAGRKVFITDLCYRDSFSLRDKSLLYDYVNAIS
jgi:hypothetical protein